VGKDADHRCATPLQIEIGVRDLRNRTGQVIDAVKAGERVTLTVHGEPVADIVPHGPRTRWLAGARLREQLPDHVAVSVITIGELQLGVLNAVDDAARARRADTLALASTADPIPVSEPVTVAWAPWSPTAAPPATSAASSSPTR